ncbi:small nuclear RNA activating protein 2 [Trypanosoma theileri]|uniref:Small nuclear RNA activating protein 2 n=1 Tax=Trypanosoma theileri TaxID=67003 RepID=A0A1X0NZ59_9TRYP|nr:small nuclear RNA activating protein 2 [Trypanosoma theileri]ORC89974.1 small nuclear RNA activating protein 2 [Trypanosoma theileri]
MTALGITLEDVNEALLMNSKLQIELQQKYTELVEAMNRISALRAALSRSNNCTKIRRRLMRKREPERANSSLPLYYLNTYMNQSLSLGPFRDAGIYAEGGIPRYAQIPLSQDEIRWREAFSSFPLLQREIHITTMQENAEEVSDSHSWSKKDDDILVTAVSSYNGIPCGPMFWKALGFSDKTRFEIACRYVALRIRKKNKLFTANKCTQLLSDTEKKKAIWEAVRKHLGDVGAMFAAYAEYLSTTARCLMYMEEAESGSTALFPPYIWDNRKNFLRAIKNFLSETPISTVHHTNQSCLDEMLLIHTHEIKTTQKPSLVDLTACLLAFKSDVLGEKCGVDELRQFFIPFDIPIRLTLRDLTQLKL